MRHIAYTPQQQNCVTAVFQAGAVSFEVPKAVTLAELAGRLAHLSERHGESLMSVEVMRGAKLATARLRGRHIAQ